MEPTQPIVGIDIGSHTVKVVVVGADARIRGIGTAESVGVSRGVVLHPHETTASVRAAVRAAALESNTEITTAYLVLGGESILEHKVTAEIDIEGAITEEDIEKLLEEAKNRVLPEMTNRTLLHEIPQAYWVDNMRTISSPLSLRGTRLGVSVLYISILDTHKHTALAAVEDAGITVSECIAAPIASSLVTLTTLQKNSGCMHILVGRDSSIATVFENGVPASIKLFPLGSNTVTEDIALAITISLDEAERLKRYAATELMKEKKKVHAAIQKRHRLFATELRAYIDAKRRVLPAGIILTGGGGQLPLLETHIREFVRLPTFRATVPKAFGGHSRFSDSSLTPALGAAIYGLHVEEERASTVGGMKKAWRAFWRWMRRTFVSILP